MKASETHTNYGVSDIYISAACNPYDPYHVAYTCFVPNTFTPGSDGINDTFYPKTDWSIIIEFKIYNASNTLIYDQNSSKNQGWDGTVNGKPAPSGVYVYTLKTHETCRNIDHYYNGECNLER